MPDKETLREVLPCPFCGSDDIRFFYAPDSWYECQGCGARSGMHTCPDHYWNRRAGSDRLAAAEKLIQAGDDNDNFDCPHDAEELCKCGLVQSDLRIAYSKARAEYDSVARGGKP